MSELTKEKSNTPWLVFKVYKNNYVVNTNMVLAISKIPEEIMNVPDNQKYIRGITNFRGNIIPLVDMKLLFKQKSNSELEAEFIEIIDSQASKMKLQIDEFTKCVKDDNYFENTKSLEGSDFMKWIDNHMVRIPDLKYSVNKILELVKKLFETFEIYGEKIKTGNKLNDIEKRRFLFDAVDNLAADLLDAFEKIKTLYHNYLQEMVIEIVNGESKIGLIVDVVKSIENITSDIGQAEFNPKIYATKFVESVAKTEKTRELVLLPNLDFLFDYAEKFDFGKVYDEFSTDDQDDMLLNEKELSEENDVVLTEDQQEISEEDYEKMLDGKYTNQDDK